MSQEQVSPEQQRAIEEKKKQLQQVIEGTLTAQELADKITRRRLEWLEENRHLLREDCPLPEAAYRLMIYDHMKAEGELLLDMNGNNSLRVEARTFCPYLEACQQLGLDTKEVCKEIGEPSIIAFFQEIDPNLQFRRDYNKIRPHHDCCVEYVEVRK